MFRIFKKKKKIENWGSYGGFSFFYKNPNGGGGEVSGHFWGDIDAVTDKSMTEETICVLKRYKKERNWTEVEYNKILMENLMWNGVLDYYKKYYSSEKLRKERKKKLKKIKKYE